MNTRLNTGSSIIYQKLIDKNVDKVFLYSGGAIMPLVDKFHSGPIEYFINTHEQSAGHAATGYAKSSNKTGVAIVTSGPGLTNMVTPLLDATNDSTPLVVFSGQVSTTNMGTNAFQECPAVDITKPVTKWSYCVRKVDELESVLDYAFIIANDGKKGSVHIDLPKDVLVDEVKEKYNFNIDRNIDYKNVRKQREKKISQLNQLSFKELANVINNSEKPIFYIGQGCNNYSELLTKLIDKSKIPVTTTIHAMGVYDEENPLSLQFLGMHGHPAANFAIQESDLIIAIGSRFDDRTTGSLSKYAPKAFEAYKENRGGIIHCNIEIDEIRKNVKSHFNYEMDAGDFIFNLLPYIKNNNRSSWLDQIHKWKKKYSFPYNPAPNEKIKTQDVIKEINKQVIEKGYASKTIYTSGVGNHQMMASQLITWKNPKSFLSSGSLGVMGVGLPYAIGAQLANPNHMIIDIDGDGSFNHTLSELKTLMEYNLPVKIAIMNDNSLTMVKIWEELFFDGRNTATASEKNPLYDKLAHAYGMEGFFCDNINDLEKKVSYFLDTPGPILCDFRVIPDKCLPLVAPGQALNEMILHSSQGNSNLVIDKQLPPS